MKIFLALFTLLIASTSHAQFTSFRPTGITGSAGFGFVHFDVNDPHSQNLEIDDGVYTAVGGERGFGAANLYLTISLNYLNADGDTDYNYVSGSNTYTSNTKINFDMTLFQAGLGLKLKLIDEGWFKPYVEAGGLFGYFQLKYKNLSSTTITGPDTNYKSSDSLFDFGYYGEAGLEITFSETFGIKAGMRMTKNRTKEFETLGDQRIDYESQVYYLGLLKQF